DPCARRRRDLSIARRSGARLDRLAHVHAAARTHSTHRLRRALSLDELRHHKRPAQRSLPAAQREQPTGGDGEISPKSEVQSPKSKKHFDIGHWTLNFRHKLMRNSKAIKVRDVQIGGGAPVVVQSMTKTDTADVAETVAQIGEMVRAGCEVVRLAVPDDAAAAALLEIRRRVPEVPLVADIHFHYKLALKAVAAGVDKLRLNPGNIGSIERVREVVRATQERGIPIRIGVNG